MKNRRAISAIPSFYVTIMTLVYALLATIIFLENARGEEENSDINNADKDNKASAQEVVQKTCKSPCPPNTEMCIQMCA